MNYPNWMAVPPPTSGNQPLKKKESEGSMDQRQGCPLALPILPPGGSKDHLEPPVPDPSPLHRGGSPQSYDRRTVPKAKANVARLVPAPPFSNSSGGPVDFTRATETVTLRALLTFPLSALLRGFSRIEKFDWRRIRAPSKRLNPPTERDNSRKSATAHGLRRQTKSPRRNEIPVSLRSLRQKRQANRTMSDLDF
jgi:hypothetical protein